MPDVVIVGAGVIGLGAAFELTERGATVMLIDPGDPRRAASWGNTGWIVPTLSGPIPAPGVMSAALRWMLDPGAPLRIVPRALLTLSPWLLQFARRCNAADYRAGLDAMGRINAGAAQELERWGSLGLLFEMRRSGVLYTAIDATHLEHIVEDLDYLRHVGYAPPIELHGSALNDAEPALRPEIRAGVLVESDAHVRPEGLVNALRESLVERGAIFRDGELVSVVHRSGARILAVETRQGMVTGDWFVVAAGSDTAALASMAGLSLPVIAGKGYSVTVTDPRLTLRRPLYLSDVRVACSPFHGANRFAGLMELGVGRREIEAHRVLAMSEGIARFLRGWEAGTARTVWAGNRALTPDGLPMLGKPMGFDNLVLATGHGMLGVTMAPVTGRVVADIVSGCAIRHDISSLHPDRFRLWRRA